MPYIDKERRERIQPYIKEASRNIENHGDLTYAIFLLCLQYMNNHGESYDSYSKCIASMECAKLEFYRKLVAPYEDKKIIINGGVQL